MFGNNNNPLRDGPLNPSLQVLDHIAQEMGITAKEIGLRKQFLELTETDVTLLCEIHAYVANKSVEDAFADLFYGHLLSFPNLRKLVPNEEALNRLKTAQAKYFKRLTAGQYDQEYVAERLRVGYVHQQIGLEPKWYTGAYRKYLSAFLPILREMSQGDDAKFQAAYGALLKVVFFDMELALDTYFHGDRLELLHMANHDALTGLPNRNLLRDRVEQAFLMAKRENSNVAILFIDLDRFKNINDSLDHATGDHVISGVAVRLASCLREVDTIARLGGDEFVVVLPETGREESISSVAEKLLRSMDEPITAGEHEFFLTVSIGVAVYPVDGKTLNEVLKNADVAMYRAKHEGRNTFRFYQREMSTQALSRLHLETQLRHALQKNEFTLHYQPQINMETAQIVAVEALLRWQSPNGMVAPVDFIPLAEETGLIVPIGEWVLETACRQAVVWNEMSKTPLRVAVNLSARQFWQHDIVQMIMDKLQITGCSPYWLELEITESIIMERPEESTIALNTLTQKGITIAIDDFGTGYSSLAYLKRFPIQSLKIDRSFVLDIATDQDDASIVRAIIALAHSMNMQVVAEGVEEESQLLFLRTQECDLVQGYYFHRPQPAVDISRHIEAQG